MRAGLATLERMESLDGWRVLESRTAAFVDTLRHHLYPLLPDLGIVRHASIFWFCRGAEPRQPQRIPAGHADWYRRFFHAALARGIYLPPSAYEVCFLSHAHDDATLDEAAGALAAAARESA